MARGRTREVLVVVAGEVAETVAGAATVAVPVVTAVEGRPARGRRARAARQRHGRFELLPPDREAGVMLRPQEHMVRARVVCWPYQSGANSCRVPTAATRARRSAA